MFDEYITYWATAAGVLAIWIILAVAVAEMKTWKL